MTKVRLILLSLLLLILLGLWPETSSEVALGAVAQWSSHNYDALLILSPMYPPRQKLTAFMINKQESLPFQVGRIAGSTAAILQGVAEIINGGQRIQGGVLVATENVIFGGAVTLSGAAEGVHGAVVVSQGVRGLVESGGQILHMAGKGGSGGGKNYTFPDERELAKRLGAANKDEFHDVIKQGIKTDFSRELQKAGIKNPDIGFDDVGNIIFKDPKTGRTLETDVPLSSYRINP